LNRNVALDILKLMLAFMVVGLHSGFLLEISTMSEYLAVNGIFRIAVPIFLLINGFYFYTFLIQKRTLTWFKRVLYLYLFWMLFYSFFWLNLSASLIHIIYALFIGYIHLWYLPGMIGAAILVMFFKEQPLWLMILAIFITFSFGVIIQYIGNYHLVPIILIDKLFNINEIHRNFLFLAFPFFGIGFLINKYKIHERIPLRLLVGLSGIGIVLLICESYFNYIFSLGGGFDNLLSLLIICPAVFLLFMNIDIKGESKELALYATSIYFVHILFYNLYLSFNFTKGTKLTLMVLFSSIVASYFLLKINKRLKFIL
jgi:hypothetical protein